MFAAIEIIVLVFLPVSVLGALIAVHSGPAERAFHNSGQKMDTLVLSAIYMLILAISSARKSAKCAQISLPGGLLQSLALITAPPEE